ncbi:hypothetical protein GGQ85_003703 [Nitrobacter vulgaris]|jgi:hypothetical protein|uniref:Uncharacterized protein n=1 Tax=Nitrobacter vulgaris TaxID=29421 RepID=A0A1V4HU33_NITVU|nr:hypothetical protein [Nitrobacter vulgaris]OPH81491.1 hypothetical protein B2M20_17360 [Nitrobacter vulgaris]
MSAITAALGFYAMQGIKHAGDLVAKTSLINKTDRNDARGIAQMMRVGLFKAVHVKTPASQHRRLLLTSRKLLQRSPEASLLPAHFVAFS